MRVLVDTHIFLWAYANPERLNEDALSLLENASIEKFFSAGSALEIAIKWAKGSLGLSDHPASLVPAKVAEAGMRNLPITVQDALRACELPNFHKDPFDRILIAQAQRNGARILTNDRVIAQYDVDVIALWLDDEE